MNSKKRLLVIHSPPADKICDRNLLTPTVTETAGWWFDHDQAFRDFWGGAARYNCDGYHELFPEHKWK